MNDALPRIHDVQGWTIEAHGRRVPRHILSAGPISATVPGCVHTDLLAAGLIEDPYLDENEKVQSWIGATDWTYRTTLPWKPDGSEHQELRFDGIDTVATVTVNGRMLGTTRNMHRTHSFDVTGVLQPGENEVVVTITSAIAAADRASLELGPRPHVNHHPYNAIRKMACSFGWDWGIDTSTSGLWQPVRLVTWSRARLADIRVAGTVVDGVPRLRVNARVLGETDGTTMRVRTPQTEVTLDVEGGVVNADLAVPDAELWWPRGFGPAHLHDVELELSIRGELVDAASRTVGFRSVEVRTEPDDSGIGFAIVVNGSTVHVRGANWIPDDAFLSRVTAARYSERLDQAEFARINLLRVWGGGIYESEDFYAECDRRGILTWQDFLFACAAYAEDEPLWSEVEAEAREAIARLGSHPSLVVLNGNNENVWARQDWGWGRRLDGRTWGAGYYYDLLPRLVDELAPHVAYTPGSPFSPNPDAAQNDPSTATTHIWDLWNTRDWPEYRDYRPRFVAEFGWQGPPTWSTLTRAVSDDPLTPESPGMLVHQKAANGNDKLTQGLVAHFAVPTNIEDWHWAMSLNQALAVRTAIEWYRSLTPHCTGTIVWQLNDSWPVTSWSAVDGEGRPKPLLHALRAAHADRLLTIQPEGDDLRLSLVNDSGEDWVDEVVIERRDYAGTILAAQTYSVRIEGRTATSIAIPTTLRTPVHPASEFVVATTSDSRALWFFREYRDSDLEPPALVTQAVRAGADWLIGITAQRLVREVTLCVDRVSPTATADRALETLLPGETVVITVSGAADADPAIFSSRTVLRSANDLL